MKYGVLGDIHGNLSALTVAVQELQRRGATSFLSVGDVVGYGAAPRECIELLRSLGALVVLCNHYSAAIDQLDITYFNPYAREAVLWTRGQLLEQDRDWIAKLPLVRCLEHCTVAHGTLHRPEQFDYMLGLGDADPSLELLTTPVCFLGHSHVPVTVLRPREDPSRTAYTPDRVVDLKESERALVNVGSVGQPRDEDPRAAFALFDSDTGLVEILRAEYDIDCEASRIRRAGLPGMLADRLYLGI
jgi:diadenosine tetraphosphatase ApaH/serine/threonine PP2A family protein phosphatase